jgi:acetyl-CoA carboxylase biotin carboxyl carrier protein
MDDKQILNLVSGFSASGLAEIDFEEGSLKLSLRRYAAQAEAPDRPAQAPRAEAIAHEHRSPRPAAPADAISSSETAGAAAAAGNLIASPLVATFYRSPGPDSPAFVEVGKKVKAGQPLCILEAMKNMNELPAEFDCEIVRILPENGSLVEFGQALFEVRRV